MIMTRWLIPFSLGGALLLSGCIPGSGRAEIYGEARPSLSQDGSISHPADHGIVILGDGQPVWLDHGGTNPGSPAPPFGNTVGMTASNFSEIPDCDGAPYALYSFFNTKRAVVLAMMSPS
jgi:hypothetical protein